MVIFIQLMILFSIILFLMGQNKRAAKIFVISMLITMFLFPKNSIEAAKNGFNLWIYVVTPSLFPFFILNDIVISLEIPDSISKLFKNYFKKLLNTSGYGAYVFIMSIFTGYPTGAKIVAQLISEKKISSYEGQKILNFASTSGPLFVIGAVGIGMFNNIKVGYILFISHILGAIINGLVLNNILYPKSNVAESCWLNKDKNTNRNFLTKSILNSLTTTGIIGGYIIFFSVLIELIYKLNIFNKIEWLLDLFLNKSLSKSIILALQGAIEITNGCNLISKSNIPFFLKILISTFIISFSGISIIMQVFSITYEEKISIKAYVISKISHSIFSVLVALLMLNFISIDSETFMVEPNIPYFINLFPLLEILLITILILNVIYFIKINILGEKY
jgi:sporulation integral membrane protein YlbJ